MTDSNEKINVNPSSRVLRFNIQNHSGNHNEDELKSEENFGIKSDIKSLISFVNFPVVLGNRTVFIEISENLKDSLDLNSSSANEKLLESTKTGYILKNSGQSFRDILVSKSEEKQILNDESSEGITPLRDVILRKSENDDSVNNYSVENPVLALLSLVSHNSKKSEKSIAMEGNPIFLDRSSESQINFRKSGKQIGKLRFDLSLEDDSNDRSARIVQTPLSLLNEIINKNRSNSVLDSKEISDILEVTRARAITNVRPILSASPNNNLKIESDSIEIISGEDLILKAAQRNKESLQQPKISAVVDRTHDSNSNEDQFDDDSIKLSKFNQILGKQLSDPNKIFRNTQSSEEVHKSISKIIDRNGESGLSNSLVEKVIGNLDLNKNRHVNKNPSMMTTVMLLLLSSLSHVMHDKTQTQLPLNGNAELLPGQLSQVANIFSEAQRLLNESVTARPFESFHPTQSTPIIDTFSRNSTTGITHFGSDPFPSITTTTTIKEPLPTTFSGILNVTPAPVIPKVTRTRTRNFKTTDDRILRTGIPKNIPVTSRPLLLSNLIPVSLAPNLFSVTHRTPMPTLVSNSHSDSGVRHHNSLTVDKLFQLLPHEFDSSEEDKSIKIRPQSNFGISKALRDIIVSTTLRPINPFKNARRFPPTKQERHQTESKCSSKLRPRCADNQFEKDFCLQDVYYPRETLKKSLAGGTELLNSFSKNAFLDDGSAVSLVDGLSRSKEEAFDYSFYNNGIYDITHWLGPEGYICPSRVYYAHPMRGRNVRGEWRIIIQNLTGIHQPVRIEKCMYPGDPCRLIGRRYGSRCLQKYTKMALLAVDQCQPGLPPFLDIFLVPSACSCHVRAYG